MIVLFRRGFTLIEAIVVIAIILILSATAIFKFREWYKNYKFLEEVSKAEYTVRWAKIKAMELYRFVKVDVENNNIKIYNCYFDASCSSSVLIRSVKFSFNIYKSGEIIFNPRGQLHTINGSICLQGESGAVKIIVNRIGIRRVYTDACS